jgi:hypothetical protein
VHLLGLLAQDVHLVHARHAQRDRRIATLPGRCRGGHPLDPRDQGLGQVGDDLPLAVLRQRHDGLPFGDDLACFHAQCGHDARIGRDERGVPGAIACQLELPARLVQACRGGVGACLLALVVGNADRAVGQQAPQAGLFRSGLFGIRGDRTHLVRREKINQGPPGVFHHPAQPVPLPLGGTNLSECGGCARRPLQVLELRSRSKVRAWLSFR